MIAALILAVFVLLPLLLFGVELIIVGAVIAAGTLARLFLGAPWIVVAERLDGLGVALAWQVAGLRRSSLVVEEIARDLDAGNEPAPEGAGRIPPPRPLA